MFYIQIDENRFQIASGNKANLVNPVLVYCLAPSDCHTLREDYQEFTGEQQWELDTAKQCIECKQGLITQLTNGLDDITAQRTIIKNMLDAGRVTEAFYNEREEALKLQLQGIYTQFDEDMEALNG